MKAVIVGYGSAGKRHARILRELVPYIDLVAVDPVVADSDVRYNTLDECLHCEKDFDIAIIATPPDQHLNGILVCKLRGVKAVLCEKPLCEIGQLGDAKILKDIKNVAVAYNYRFHFETKRSLIQDMKPGVEWVCYSEQQRKNWPKWGIFEDHCCHTLDLLCLISGGHLRVESAIDATQILSDGFRLRELIKISGRTGNNTRFTIIESVYKSETKRLAWIAGPTGYLDFTKNVEDMFVTQMKSFLYCFAQNKPFLPGITEAIHTQQLLEDTNRIMVRQEFA